MLKHASLIREEPESFKDRTFRIFHHVINEYTVPSSVLLALMVAEAFQILLYCIHPNYPRTWAIPFIVFVQKVLGFIELSELWEVGGLVVVLIWNIISNLSVN